MRPEPAASLLATPRRQKLLEHIWQRTSLSRRQFATLYLAPLERYAELVQQFPRVGGPSPRLSGRHAGPRPGDRRLRAQAAAVASAARRRHAGGASRQAEAWTAGTAYAALLHDIGKIAVDLHVEYAGRHGLAPWHGPLRRPYRFRYRKGANIGCTAPPPGCSTPGCSIPASSTGSPAIPTSGPRCCTCWPASTNTPACSANWSCSGPGIGRPGTRRRSQQGAGSPGTHCSASCSTACATCCGRVQAEPAPGLGWLADPGRVLAGEQDRLGQLRAHLLSQGIDGIPANNTAVFNVLQDHGLAADARRQGDLEGHRHQRRRLVAQLHLPEAVAGDGLGCGRPAGTVRGSRAGRRGTRGATPQAWAAEAPAWKGRYRATEHRAGARARRQRRGCAARSAGDMAPTRSAGAPSDPEPSLATVAYGAAAGEPAPSQDRPEPSGEHFMAWLRQGIQTRKLIINDAKALVHSVAGNGPTW